MSLSWKYLGHPATLISSTGDWELPNCFGRAQSHVMEGFIFCQKKTSFGYCLFMEIFFFFKEKFISPQDTQKGEKGNKLKFFVTQLFVKRLHCEILCCFGNRVDWSEGKNRYWGQTSDTNYFFCCILLMNLYSYVIRYNYRKIYSLSKTLTRLDIFYIANCLKKKQSIMFAMTGASEGKVGGLLHTASVLTDIWIESAGT